MDEEEGGSDGEEGDDATPQSRIATSLDSDAITLVTPRQNEPRLDEVVEAELPGGGMRAAADVQGGDDGASPVSFSRSPTSSEIRSPRSGTGWRHGQLHDHDIGAGLPNATRPTACKPPLSRTASQLHVPDHKIDPGAAV